MFLMIIFVGSMFEFVCVRTHVHVRVSEIFQCVCLYFFVNIFFFQICACTSVRMSASVRQETSMYVRVFVPLPECLHV